MRIMRSKSTGRKPKLTAAEPMQDSHVIDLMTRLRESLERGRGRTSRKSSASKKSKKEAPARRGRRRAA